MKHLVFLTDVEEDVIISVLAKRSNEQRQRIKVVYEASAGEVSNALLMRTESHLVRAAKSREPAKNCRKSKSVVVFETCDVQQTLPSAHYVNGFEHLQICNSNEDQRCDSNKSFSPGHLQEN